MDMNLVIAGTERVRGAIPKIKQQLAESKELRDIVIAAPEVQDIPLRSRQFFCRIIQKISDPNKGTTPLKVVFNFSDIIKNHVTTLQFEDFKNAYLQAMIQCEPLRKYRSAIKKYLQHGNRTNTMVDNQHIYHVVNCLRLAAQSLADYPNQEAILQKIGYFDRLFVLFLVKARTILQIESDERSRKKDIEQAYKEERGRNGADLAAVGLNSTYYNHMLKVVLNVMAPGEGTQKEKAERVQGSPITGSCIMATNRVALGGATFLNSVLSHKIKRKLSNAPASDTSSQKKRNKIAGDCVNDTREEIENFMEPFETDEARAIFVYGQKELIFAEHGNMLLNA